MNIDPHILLYPRGKAGGTYYAVVFDGQRKKGPFSIKTKDRETAYLWRDQEMARLRAPHVETAKPALTFDAAWDAYEKLPAVATKSPHTMKHERGCYRMFAAWCEAQGCTTVDAVTPAMAKEYRREMQRERNISATSVNNYISNVKPVWAYLIQEEVLDCDNPFRAIQPLKVSKKAPKSRSWDDVQAILLEAEQLGTDITLFLTLGLYLGIRRLEILRARWEDIDWTGQTITIHKTKPRPMQYTVNLYPELVERLLPHRQPVGYIVAPESPTTDALALRWNYYRPLQAVFDSLNSKRPPEERIEPFSAHQLRHTLITHLRSLGWSLGDVAAFVCQNETAITEKYGEAGPELRRASLNISLERQG